MHDYDEDVVTIDQFGETWHRDKRKIVDDDGTIKEIIPDTHMSYAFKVLGKIADVRKFQELVTEFIFNHPDVVLPQYNEDDD